MRALDTEAAFLDAVTRFCAFVETEQAESEESWLATASALLALLIANAMDLPQVEPLTDRPEEIEETGPLCLRIPADAEIYWEVFHSKQDEEPCAGSLTDDFSDIYRDLQRGLVAHKAGRSADAIWEWRFGFHGHWGRHAVSALRAIYCYLHR